MNWRDAEQQITNGYIDGLRIDRQMLIELVLDDTLTPAAKRLIAIAIRDGGLAPTDETLAWAKQVAERVTHAASE